MPKPEEHTKDRKTPQIPDFSRCRRNYDHIHWARINGKPLDSEMGTLSDHNLEKDHPDTGRVVLLGRAKDGRHYTLFGPLTPDEYHDVRRHQEASVPDKSTTPKLSRAKSSIVLHEKGGREGRG